jgi:hypothetical protein
MKFNLLTKYLFVYAAVALLGFLGVTFISYRIDYAKVYNYYTDALYKQALSISSEYADDYFSEEHLRIVETELRTVALLNDTRIMFIDTFWIQLMHRSITQKIFYTPLMALIIPVWGQNTRRPAIFTVCLTVPV